ncbi:MAG: hypothetical protein ACRBBM_13070 [Pseudomonadaceae bacterium]
MFDNGMSEWALVLVVALLVLGPQRALVIINMAGVMLGKAKAAMAQVQDQVRRELPVEEVEVVREKVQELRRSNVKRKAAEVLGLEEKRADTRCVGPLSPEASIPIREAEDYTPQSRAQ